MKTPCWKRTIVLTFLIAALLLSSCGGAETPTTPTAAVPPSATPGPQPSPTTEQIATQTLESPLPTLEGDTPTQEGEDVLPDENGGMPTEEGQLFPEDETPQPDETLDAGDESNLDTVETPVEGPFQPTPADIPLGQPGNPLILGVVTNSGQRPELLDASRQLAEQIAQLSGYSIEAVEVNSTTELLNGMQIGAIHIAWMQPFTYILASRREYAKVALVTKHFGVYAYGMQFLANTASDITPYFDTSTNSNTADAAEALAQFAEKRPCWVDPLSASGYVVPSGELGLQGITIQPALFMQSHTAVVRALYVMGICDFGATYAIYGDPRTAAVLQEDLPDVLQKVAVIWQSGEVIPNLNLAFQSEVPDEIVEKVTQTLLDYVLGPDGLEIVNQAAGYEITDLKQVDDTFYDPLRELLQYSRVNLRTLVGK